MSSPWSLTGNHMQALDAYLHTGSVEAAAENLALPVRRVAAWLDEARMFMGMPHRVAMVAEWAIYRTQ